jgi:ribosomal protein S18 acetylase RimI-like enzyme
LDLVITPISAAEIQQYARVPLSIIVDSVLEIAEVGSAYHLTERLVQPPYLKEFNAFPDASPLDWPKRFQLDRWGMWIARHDGRPIGAAAVAWNEPGLESLQGATDIAEFWDIRVHPDFRRRGLGSALFDTAVRYAKSRECTLLTIETQNTNVAASRFYRSRGCALASVDRDAYRDIPALMHETRLIWHLPL